MSVIPPRQSDESTKQQIADEIERRRRNAKDEGLYFTPLPEDQLQRSRLSSQNQLSQRAPTISFPLPSAGCTVQ